MMMEILNTLQGFLTSLVTWAWGLVVLVSTFCWDLLYSLHMTSPRLEGLLVGVALAWLMLRRDKHPALRVLSSPLKLVLDILDLGWDQVVEVVVDGWSAVYGWITGSLNWCKTTLTGLYNGVMSVLHKVKTKLTKK